ncbi:MAG: OB-fold nucleic acid binding domain-containing protein, partial [Halorientalis sp.]
MTPSPTPDDGGDAADDAPLVYDLADGCSVEDAETGDYYHATVNGVVEYGVFVDLCDAVSGLVHESNLVGSHEVGDDLVVELEEVRENGDLAFTEVQLAGFATEHVAAVTSVPVADLEDAVGETVSFEGVVVQIKQTGGPTIFHVRGEGAVVPCAAFEEAGVRAHPDVELDDVVRISGRAERREDAVQVEVEGLERLAGEAETEARERLDAALEAHAEPAEVEPLVEWPALETLREDLRDVAARLRAAALDGRPIRMRHHADGDGICAAVPVQLALEQFLAETHHDPEAPRHLLKRLPSKAPFYEMEDVTRDLNYALEDRSRHGQRLPLLLMLDNGSTEEDTPAYRNLAHYDVPIVVVDHHHPDPEAVEPLVSEHVNPYLHGEDYRITTGM